MTLALFHPFRRTFVNDSIVSEPVIGFLNRREQFGTAAVYVHVKCNVRLKAVLRIAANGECHRGFRQNCASGNGSCRLDDAILNDVGFRIANEQVLNEAIRS
jgi:hypothetical protein